VDGAPMGIGFLWPIYFFFENNEFGKEREGKTFIQVRCKIHTLNENRSMVMYPLNT
jgi:hypothetical protein